MRLARVVAVLALAAGAAACTSLRDQAGPACPYCGNPTMKRLPDGTEVVVPRMRLATFAASPARASDFED